MVAAGWAAASGRVGMVGALHVTSPVGHTSGLHMCTLPHIDEKTEAHNCDTSTSQEARLG